MMVDSQPILPIVNSCAPLCKQISNFLIPRNGCALNAADKEMSESQETILLRPRMCRPMSCLLFGSKNALFF